jgi:hypothetical protein
MWRIAITSMGLFLRGKLFANPFQVCRQLAIGIFVTAITLFGLAMAGVPVWTAAIIAGFGGGLLQPYLFKDLSFR